MTVMSDKDMDGAAAEGDDDDFKTMTRMSELRV